MHTPGFPGFTALGTALVAEFGCGPGVTWRRFECNAAWLYRGGYMSFAVTLKDGF